MRIIGCHSRLLRQASLASTRLAVIALLVMFAMSARAQETFTGQWMLERRSADSVQFTLRYSSDGYGHNGWWNSSWSTDTALASLQGLTPFEDAASHRALPRS